MDRIVGESEAEDVMKQLDCADGGVAIMLPKTKFRLLFLEKVDSGTANIIKQTMLSVGGDAAVAIKTVSCKVPDTDILLMGTLTQYNRAIRSLKANVLGSPAIAERIEKLLE